jgi:hypothetical protein
MWPVEFDDSVQSRAVRCLRDVPTFTFTAMPPADARVPDDESVVGVYEFPLGVAQLIVTGHGIRLGDTWQLVRYEDILGIQGPLSKTDPNPGITLSLADGSEARVLIQGQMGRFQDVWAFVRFLSRVSDDASAT